LFYHPDEASKRGRGGSSNTAFNSALEYHRAIKGEQFASNNICLEHN
jgi:hypothetical protein